MPTTAVWNPSGNGGCSGVPRTKCVLGTGRGSGRPGSAFSRSTILVLEAKSKSMYLSVPRKLDSLHARRPDDRGGAEGLPCLRLHDVFVFPVATGHGVEGLQRSRLGGGDEHLAADVLELGEEAGVDGDLVAAGVLEDDHRPAVVLAVDALTTPDGRPGGGQH